MLVRTVGEGVQWELVSNVRNDDTLKYQRHFLAMLTARDVASTRVLTPVCNPLTPLCCFLGSVSF